MVHLLNSEDCKGNNTTTHFRGTAFLFGHALANFAFVAVLTSSFALACFQ